jgi:hypothetical protein
MSPMLWMSMMPENATRCCWSNIKFILRYQRPREINKSRESDCHFQHLPRRNSDEIVPAVNGAIIMDRFRPTRLGSHVSVKMYVLPTLLMLLDLVTKATWHWWLSNVYCSGTTWLHNDVWCETGKSFKVRSKAKIKCWLIQIKKCKWSNKCTKRQNLILCNYNAGGSTWRLYEW